MAKAFELSVLTACFVGFFEGVITALYQGQLFEKLRLAEKRITSRDVLESTTRDTDSDTQTDMEGTAPLAHGQISFGRLFFPPVASQVATGLQE